jgi:hypothetical protein
MYCLRRAIGHPHHQVPGNIEIHMRSMMAPLVVFEALLKQLGDFKYPEAQRVLYVEADGSIPYRLDNVILTQLGYSYKDEEAYNGVMITGGNIAAVAATVTACPMDHLPKPPQSAVSSTPTSSPEKDAVSAVENLDDTLD